MPVTLTSLADLAALGFDTIIDVRSPSEYAEDHVPGAISLPVLSDDERARVGTIYKQEAPFAARKVGAALVARNAAAHLEGPLEAGQIAVGCALGYLDFRHDARGWRAGRPRLAAWYAGFAARPSMKATVPA